MSGKPLGDRGERLAAEFLEERGWALLERNFRLGRNEVDLVARRGEVVAFVEVKTRTGYGYGHPLEAITRRKRREIERVAAYWVTTRGDSGQNYRFDAIAIQFEPGVPPRIDHVENAWWVGQ